MIVTGEQAQSAGRARRFAWAAACVAAALAALSGAAWAGDAAGAKGLTGLPLPRFASLKTDKVNMRSGPSTDYPTLWVYSRAGLPVEITQEFEVWRQIRDSAGAVGWAHSALLSGRRTAVVLPWEVKEGAAPSKTPLFASDSARSREIALVEAGVIANLHRCDGKWCAVTVAAHRGYIEQPKLWGVYPNETVE